MIKLKIHTKYKIFFASFSNIIKIIFFAAVFNVFFNSCSKNIEAPKAIIALIDSIKAQNPDCGCEPYIDEYTWRNEFFYLSSCHGPNCDCIANLYDANGQQIDLIGNIEFSQESKFVRHVWTCK